MDAQPIDPVLRSALDCLNDVLCTLERTNGKKYALLLIPESQDEQIHMSQNGKSLPQNIDMSPDEILRVAMNRRKKQGG